MYQLLRHSRNLYYLAMILLFLVLAPLVVLYTLGYRLDRDMGSIVQTGVLVLASKPSRATVQIDKTPRTERTTAHIDAVKTGSYSITVSKETYIPWQKTLRIDPGHSTIAEDIVLFKEHTSSRILLTDPLLSDVRAVGDQRFLLVSQQEEQAQLMYWFRETEQPVLLGSFDGTLTIVGIHPSAEKVLLRLERSGTATYYIGDLSPYLRIGAPSQETMPLSLINDLLPAVPDDIAWDMRDATILWARYQTTLVHIDLAAATRTIIAHNVSGMLESPQGLVYLERTADGLHLLRMTTPFRQDINIPIAQKDSTILAANGNSFVVTNSVATTLYTVPHPGVLMTQDLAGPVSHAEWQDTSRLLLWSQSELTIYDARTHIITPLARFSEPIQHAQWYDDEAYIAFVQGSRFVVTEIDTRDHLNHIVVDLPKDTSLRAISADGAYAWFFTPSKEPPGRLWRVQMR